PSAWPTRPACAPALAASRSSACSGPDPVSGRSVPNRGLPPISTWWCEIGVRPRFTLARENFPAPDAVRPRRSRTHVAESAPHAKQRNPQREEVASALEDPQEHRAGGTANLARRRRDLLRQARRS